MKQIKRLLIANRGEIACRIIKTAQKMGIVTIAIYADIEKHAKHVAMADMAISLGSSNLADSYLNHDKIRTIAATYKADAIHPGYGFLSENALFATSCINAGICWIGPSPKAMTLMANKDAARLEAIKSAVPVVPGFEGALTETNAFDEAEKIGYPILIKAVAGGGGRGMRIVTNKETLLEKMRSAANEAQQYFDNPNLLFEKYIDNARHIEIQILADTHNNTTHLFSRDCSLQRRYQKVVEEAPAPNISNETAEKMYTCAIGLAQSIGYIGAGTVEMLYNKNDESFYFMEMNTRLQVEHPITEMICNVDLVEWQIRIANGEKLPKNGFTHTGHAIEARICAENWQQEFMPAVGTIRAFDFPTNVRVDSGYNVGDVVSSQYDSLLAKVISYAPTRDGAISQLEDALHTSVIVGVESNINLHQLLLASPIFTNCQFSTKSLETQIPKLLEDARLTDSELVCASVVHFLANASCASGFRVQHQNAVVSNAFCYQGKNYITKASKQDDIWAWQLSLDPQGIREQKGKNLDSTFDSSLYTNEKVKIMQVSAQSAIIAIGCAHYQTSWWQDASVLHIHIFYTIGKRASLAPPVYTQLDVTTDGNIRSPMNGTVIVIKAKLGDTVQVGDELLIISAMKMELSVNANISGTIAYAFSDNQANVKQNQLLFTIQPDNDNTA